MKLIGYIALYFAVQSDNFELVDAIINKAEFNINTKSKFIIAIGGEGVSIMDILFHTKSASIEMMAHLIENGAATKWQENKLILATHLGCNDYVKDLCHTEDIVATSAHGFTALHHAVMNENINLVKIFINNGAAIDTENMYGVSPIDSALIRVANRYEYSPQDLEGIETLKDIVQGLVMHSSDDYKNQALLKSIANGTVETTMCILDLGADLRTLLDQAESPLYLAAKEGQLEQLNYLREAYPFLVDHANETTPELSEMEPYAAYALVEASPDKTVYDKIKFVHGLKQDIEQQKYDVFLFGGTKVTLEDGSRKTLPQTMAKIYEKCRGLSIDSSIEAYIDAFTEIQKLSTHFEDKNEIINIRSQLTQTRYNEYKTRINSIKDVEPENSMPNLSPEEKTIKPKL